jgi:hypothetical protein
MEGRVEFRAWPYGHAHTNQEPEIEGAQTRQPSPWPHGKSHMTRGSKNSGVAPCYAHFWVFQLYVIIFMIFKPVLGDFVHYWRIWSPF